MSTTFLFPIILFALSTSITPGPNNIMLTASGANFGFKRTIPHIFGVWFGVFLLLVLSAFGLQKLFVIFPPLKFILKIAGVSYMLFLAFKIASSKNTTEKKVITKPLTFFQAAAFQVVNPKAVMMAVTSMSVYTLKGEYFLLSALAVVVAFFMIGIPSISLWAGFGTIIGRYLKNNTVFKIFNYSMGALTACSAILLII